MLALLKLGFALLVYYLLYIFELQISTLFAMLYVLLSTNLVGLVTAFATVIFLVKAVFIFKQCWIVDVPEDEIILLARVVTTFYAGIRFVIDYSLPERETMVIEMLSGVKMST